MRESGTYVGLENVFYELFKLGFGITEVTYERHKRESWGPRVDKFTPDISCSICNQTATLKCPKDNNTYCSEACHAKVH